MSEPKKYFDVTLLAVFLFFITVGFWQHFNNGNVVYLNNLVGAILLFLAIALKIGASKYDKYAVLMLLLLSTFGIINFIVGSVARVGVGNEDAGGSFIQTPGIDPLTLLILILYCAINYSFVWDCYLLMFHGSENEQKKKHEDGVSFYYNKFSTSTEDELVKCFEMYVDYPVDAQVALDKIRQEKGGKI